jgi:hypothetical protein
MPRVNLLSDQTISSLKEGAARESASTFNGQNVNDVQRGTGAPGSVLDSVNFVPLDNPMSELFQPTYHFSFYLDTDIETNQGKGQEFVIAETGLTGMNIQNVEIEGFVGPNIRTKNANATSITIKIYEPFGAMLPDLLYQAAVTMNIRNYLKAPWFLRLKLHGYDGDGKVITVGEDWKWKMVLIDVQSQISENGSLHTIQALPLAEVALNNQYCMLPALTNTSGATVGEALQNVIKSMNESVEHRYGATHPPFIEYAVEERPYPFDTKVGVSSPFGHMLVSDQPQTSNQSTNSAYDAQNSHFAQGTDFPKIVDLLMSRCDSAVKMARLSRDVVPTDAPDEEKEIRDVVSILHRIDTKVEYLSYDTVFGDYCKKITFVVKPFNSLRLLTSMGRAQRFDRDSRLNRDKAAFATGRSYLKKQYDYVFTGLNTEVEKFDINVNFRWAVSVPIIQNRSFTGTPARVDDALVAQDASSQLDQSSRVLDQARLEAKTLDDQIIKLETEGTTVDQKIIDAKAEAEKRVAEALKDNQQKGTIAAMARDKVNQAAEAASKARRIPNGRVVDGEDAVYDNIQSDEKGAAKSGFGGASAGDSSFMPLTIIKDADNPGSSMSVGSSTDNNANKSVYGTLLNQLYGSFDANLQNIELDVRGDPYWLGPGSDGTLYDTDSNDQTPNFINGEHMFVFRFKLPQGYDENTGSVSLPKGIGGNSNIFTGFYAVTQITHHFREGVFSQTLNGVRIQGWSYENIIEGRAPLVEDDTQYTNVPPATQSSNVASGTSTATRGSGYRATGVSRGTRNNNPGNLRDGKFARRQPGYTGPEQNGSPNPFATFDTKENGIAAQERLLERNYVQSPTTVEAVIDRYLGKNVPGNMNSDASRAAYKRVVTQRLGKSNITTSDVPNLAAAMRYFETGGR